MGRYSQLDSPQVDEIIARVVNRVALSLRPKSIILAGGFGRGEGSFMEVDGKLRFLSDCEITVMLGRYMPRSRIEKLATELTQETDLEIELHDSMQLWLFSSFPQFGQVLKKLWKPSLQHYDLKYASLVVFGENILDRLPEIKAEDIPFWEGIRLVFNRMAASLAYFPSGNQNHDKVIYWINKIILACQDALLLSMGRYHHSYQARNLMFQEMLPGVFGELNGIQTKFLPLVKKATEYKLKPDKDSYSDDVAGLWFDAAEICDQVFRHIIKRDMGINFDFYTDFQSKYLAHSNIREKYYLGIIPSSLLQNIITIKRMILADSCRFPSFKLLTSIRTPWKHIVYSLIPLVYFGLSPDGKVDESQLERARDIISLFKQLKPKSEEPFQEWEYISEQTVDLWQHLCY